MSTKPIIQPDDNMPAEIDFNRAERGKFFHPNSKSNLPIYIDSNLHAQLSSIANAQGLDVSAVANAFLKKNIDALQSKE